MVAAMRIPSLLSRSLSLHSPSSLLFRGRIYGVGRLVSSYTTTAAAFEKPITPSVNVNYTRLLINGNYVDSASGKTFPTYDPRTGDVIAHVAEGDAEDIDRAVSAARKAFDEGPWPKMTAYERSRVLFRFADLLDEHAEELATLETWDNGKPYEQAAKVELPMISRLIRYYAGWADKIHASLSSVSSLPLPTHPLFSLALVITLMGVLFKMSVTLGFFVGLTMLSLASSAKFHELFQPGWAMDHFIYEGELLKLKLDNYSGAGFASKSKYLFGKVTTQIKLVEGDSAGTVTAYYMSSDGPNHNEFDFEFLGNTTGEPYLVQTNVYVNGVGNREQRMNLWFDPTKEFHSYSILWNQRQVVFLVDETPIRVHTNMEHKGIPFPKDQAMGVYSSIWNADDWATQGGLVKTDWSHAPFIASYKGFEIDACECPGSVAADENAKKCSGNGDKRFWWDEPTMSELSLHQSHQLLWVRANHLVYDYCTDTARFPVMPVECEHHRH